MGIYCTLERIPRHAAQVGEIMEVRWVDLAGPILIGDKKEVACIPHKGCRLEIAATAATAHRDVNLLVPGHLSGQAGVGQGESALTALSFHRAWPRPTGALSARPTTRPSRKTARKNSATKMITSGRPRNRCQGRIQLRSQSQHTAAV